MPSPSDRSERARPTAAAPLPRRTTREYAVTRPGPSLRRARSCRWRGTVRRPRPARVRATRRGAPARWRSDPLDLPFSRERDRAAERGLSSLELPGEAADDEPLVLELGRLDLAA